MTLARSAKSVPVVLLAFAVLSCGGSKVATTHLPAKERLDLAVNRYYGADYAGSALALYAVMSSVPATEPIHDSAELYLAGSLAEMGFSQAGVELYLDTVAARRAPELVASALAALDKLARRRLADARRLVDLFFGDDYGELPGDTAELVEYYQGIGEINHGFADWGARRLGKLSKSRQYYGWKARFALAVHRLAVRQDDGAAAILDGIIKDRAAPPSLVSDALLARARMLYEQKDYRRAFEMYGRIRGVLTEMDPVLLERAWAGVSTGGERRALGMLVGLEAPIYRGLMAPERDLMRTIALRDLCQYRLAHLAVVEFREKYQSVLAAIKVRKPLSEVHELRQAALRRVDLVPSQRWLAVLEKERAEVGRIADRGLRNLLIKIHDARAKALATQVEQELRTGTEALADELLAIDEKMSIIDYELGIGLFKKVAESKTGRTVESSKVVIPASSEKVYYRHHGEYWSDELQDYSVMVRDRCIRERPQ
ncbi:MAG: hypothetical protein V2A73_07530 [Pseudomonadota bacterium]